MKIELPLQDANACCEPIPDPMQRAAIYRPEKIHGCATVLASLIDGGASSGALPPCHEAVARMEWSL